MTILDAVIFLLITVLMGGLAAWATGRAVARSWAPLWHLVVYLVLLAFAVRFLHFALAGGSLLSLGAFALDLGVLAAIASLTYRFTRESQMIAQYPWLFGTAGPSRHERFPTERHED